MSLPNGLGLGFFFVIQRLQLYLSDGQTAEFIPQRSNAFDGDKFRSIEHFILPIPRLLEPTIVANAYQRMVGSGYDTQARAFVITNEGKGLLNEFWVESFDVPVFFFALIINHRNRSLWMPLFQVDHLVIKPRVQVETGESVLTR